jgi:hypothetical protein
MKKIMTAAFTLSALFVASGEVHAEVNYPWCIQLSQGRGATRSCYYATWEQCYNDAFYRGGVCVPSLYYHPPAAQRSPGHQHLRSE